jgi:hypothetical protein
MTIIIVIIIIFSNEQHIFPYGNESEVNKVSEEYMQPPPPPPPNPQLVTEALTYSLLWDRKFHSRIHNSLPLTSTLSHLNPVNTLLPFLYQIHFNIILPPSPRPSTRLFLSVIPNDIPFLCMLHTPPLSFQ